jgi:hypothetical protein
MARCDRNTNDRRVTPERLAAMGFARDAPKGIA